MSSLLTVMSGGRIKNPDAISDFEVQNALKELRSAEEADEKKYWYKFKTPNVPLPQALRNAPDYIRKRWRR